MTRDEIIKMAREAGFVDESFCRWGAYSDDLERFAALVEQHLIASGYRKCAVGQRTTQFCGQLEQAVLAERELITRAAMLAAEKAVDAAMALERQACIDINAMHKGSVEVEAAIRARSAK